MKTIVTILGARPQFIKASVVSAQIAKLPDLKEIVVHTGQHFDNNMSEVFFEELGMAKPKYSLSIHGGGHGEMTGRMLIEIEKVLLVEKPDAVLVYGDTNSTLAGALSAAKLHIPVAHVEAGLRSFNMRMPEEVNRILTDRVSRWLFTPNELAGQHLVREGMEQSRIIQVGDVMYDVALFYGDKSAASTGALAKLRSCDDSTVTRDYCLATIHRAENTDSPVRLRAIVEALQLFSEDLQVVWPLHPRTRGILRELGLLDSLSRSVTLCEPVGYLDMVQLERNAALIATDSGGVQKEAYFYRVPCVTVRDETEWNELVSAGWNRLSPPSDSKQLLEDLRRAVGTKGLEVSLYGKGDSAHRIVECLASDLC